jgi:dihydrofolate reductase
MGVSADGFIARSDGTIGLMPSEELHRFHNRQAEELGVHVMGRRLYEVMSFWENFEAENPSAPAHELEFARIWRGVPKVVFSRTLGRAEGSNTRLAEGDLADEIRQLKEQPGGDISVGGADLAASLMKLDLIDEFAPVVHPVVLGGGTPFFPPLEEQVNLRLVESRTFGMGEVYLRYSVLRG